MALVVALVIFLTVAAAVFSLERPHTRPRR